MTRSATASSKSCALAPAIISGISNIIAGAPAFAVAPFEDAREPSSSCLIKARMHHRKWPMVWRLVFK